MPRSNRPKNPNSSSKAHTRKPSQTVIYTKRQEILDEEGWTHVVDTPRRKQRSATLTKATNGGLHTGDFEIDGVGYVNRTKEEMAREVEFWRKSWEGDGARVSLERMLKGREEEEEKKGDGENGGEVVEQVEGENLEGDAVAAPQASANSKEVSAEEDKSADVVPKQEISQVATATVTSEATREASASTRRKVDNIIVLGLGSLQSARREGRRATLTQLAALETIVKHFEKQSEQPMKVIFQEPHFTPLDIEYLQSSPSYEVVNDPVAFSKITEGSLVYAVHCYSQVYRAISEGPRPAVLIGTDMGNFGKFNMSDDAETTQKQLDQLIENCEVLNFPQVRHDFSDTKIYWRTQSWEST